MYYDEAVGVILVTSPHLCSTGEVPGTPSLSGWTTYLQGSPHCGNPTPVSVAATTGVVIALSPRPACDIEFVPSCLEDSGFSTVDSLCQQSPGLVDCYAANNGIVDSGLQFIRGYSQSSVSGPPAVRGVWFEGGTCASPSFNVASSPCASVLRARIDLGSVSATNAEVRYKIATTTGASCAFTTACGLSSVGGPDDWAATNPPPQFAAGSGGNAVAIRVRVRNAIINGVNCGVTFSTRCQWFYTGSGISTTEPSDNAVVNSPLARSFMADSVSAGPIRGLRLYADPSCSGGVFPVEGEAASQPLGQPTCFVIDLQAKAVTAPAQAQDDPGGWLRPRSGPVGDHRL